MSLAQKKPKLKTELDSVSYSLGLSIGHNLVQQGLDDLNDDLFVQGVMTVLEGAEEHLTQEQSQDILVKYFRSLQEKQQQANVEAGKSFLEDNKKREGVVALESGLQYEILKEGSGTKPKATDKVRTHYHGTLIDGTVFDSSVERGQPAEFPVNGVIKGWQEALQLMPVGSKWKLYVPPHLAYGERGAGGVIGPNATLIFEVELLEIIK